ncbi:MAG: ArnT family glycosyltransferase [Roseiflexus sp.]
MDVDTIERNERYALPLLCILFLATRLPGLAAIPLFNDEAVYLFRAQHFPAEFLSTVHDGKLIHELMLAALAHLPMDPLVSGRLLSVACGWLTVIGLWLSGKMAVDPRAGIFAGLFYICSPLAIVHDMLAIPDSMLTSIASFVLALSLRLNRLPNPTRWHAAGVGALVALAGLVKLAGVFLFALPALALLVQTMPHELQHRRWVMIRTALIVTLLALAAFAPFNYGGAENRKVGALDPTLQVERLGQNLSHIGEWMMTAMPLPVPIIAGIGLATSPDRRQHLFLFLSAILFCLALATIGSVLYPRYILPAWTPILFAAGLSLSQYRQHWKALHRIGVALTLITFLWGAFFAFQYTRNPAYAPLTVADRRQYIEKWTAGYHTEEIVHQLRLEAERSGSIVLVSPLQLRLIHFAPKIYLDDDPRITFIDIDMLATDARQHLGDLAAQRPLYIALDAEEVRAFDIEQRFPELKCIREWRNPYSTMAFFLYVWSP